MKGLFQPLMDGGANQDIDRDNVGLSHSDIL